MRHRMLGALGMAALLVVVGCNDDDSGGQADENGVTVDDGDSGGTEVDETGVDPGDGSDDGSNADDPERRPGDDIEINEDNINVEEDCRDGEVRVVGTGNRVELLGSCPRVIVSGDDNDVDVEQVETLEVTGSDNRVNTNEVGLITVTGNGNVINYVAGFGGDGEPDIDDTGNGNVLTQEGD